MKFFGGEMIGSLEQLKAELGVSSSGTISNLVKKNVIVKVGYGKYDLKDSLRRYNRYKNKDVENQNVETNDEDVKDNINDEYRNIPYTLKEIRLAKEYYLTVKYDLDNKERIKHLVKKSEVLQELRNFLGELKSSLEVLPKKITQLSEGMSPIEREELIYKLFVELTDDFIERAKNA